MAYQPAKSLNNRTFIGLLIAQFFAAFNDQAIHAAAMFFAINKQAMSPAAAISLMPILFYAPWAIFCTLAGYFADRFSKQYTLIFWKLAEVAICGVATLGFWLGETDTRVGGIQAGPYLLLACVFLMGTHSAFFVPAKYGVMPEILVPHLLSRGNGLLESLSFFAVILGTVSGGMLSFLFKGQESIIGGVLLGFALVGALASFLIKHMPPANPTRPFPPYIYGPLIRSLIGLFSSRPLAFAVTGIAFFTFIVAFMRAAVYMLGESQNPRWDEFTTSLVVGGVAVGIALGSPLAGWFSGGKVELGLVSWGALGMTVAVGLSAMLLNWIPALVVTIMLTGFFTGFYIVPLYTLQQHRAPKTGKGDVIAISNFINVTGAILATLVFYLVVKFTQTAGFLPRIDPRDGFAAGELVRLETEFGVPVLFDVRGDDGELIGGGRPADPDQSVTRLLARTFQRNEGTERTVIDLMSGLVPARDGEAGSEVVVSTYSHHGLLHYHIRPAGTPLLPVFEREVLPRYLFLGAAAMTMLTFLILWWQLPDLPLRSWWWLRSACRRVHVEGLDHLPGTGAVLLVGHRLHSEARGDVRASVDRPVLFLKASPTPAQLARAEQALAAGRVVGLTSALSPGAEPILERLLKQSAAIVPVSHTSVSGAASLTVLIFGASPPAEIEAVQSAVATL